MAGRNSKGGGDFKGNLVAYKNRLVLKNEADGNTNKKKQEINDWVFGPIGENVLGGWSKYIGGNEELTASYETTDYVERDDFPNL